MNNRKILKRIVRLVNVKFVSPVCISSGDDDFTDLDVIKDYDGNPFIPGTTIAGSMRDYFHLQEGPGSNENKDMSSFFISDMTFKKPVNTSVRDGVCLDENKQTVEGGKYDMEVICSSSIGAFYMELIIRENDDETKFMKQWDSFLRGINNGYIRFGSKKNRGYGEAKIEFIKENVYSKENIFEYEKAYDEASYKEKDIHFSNNSGDENNDYVKLTIPLKLKGGISIRTYSAKKGQPDFSHITSNDKPVIPGTSISGALRHRCYQLLVQDMCVREDGAKKIIERLFGSSHDRNGQIHQSSTIFKEYAITGSQSLSITRTAISRFEFSPLNRSLYTENAYVNGEVKLEIYIKKYEKWMIGLLIIAFHDLQKGYLAIGGETSIGRGIFEGNEIKIDDNPLTKNDERLYLDALKGEIAL